MGGERGDGSAKSGSRGQPGDAKSQVGTPGEKEGQGQKADF